MVMNLGPRYIPTNALVLGHLMVRANLQSLDAEKRLLPLFPDWIARLMAAYAQDAFEPNLHDSDSLEAHGCYAAEKRGNRALRSALEHCHATYMPDASKSEFVETIRALFRPFTSDQTGGDIARVHEFLTSFYAELDKEQRG